MDEQLAWIKSNRKRRLRAVAVLLCLCLLFTAYPNILETLSIFAEESQGKKDVLHVSGFAELPEDIREQDVPVGTEAEGLLLPDTLEVAVIMPESGETQEESSDEEETGDDSVTENTGENTDTENIEDTEESTDTENIEDTEKNTDTGNIEDTEENTDVGNIEDTEENTDTGNGDGQDTWPEEIVEEAAQETYTITMQEYYAENVITVETLENTQAAEEPPETVIVIEGVTWSCEPEYDGNTEGAYLFTAVLPENYVPKDGVGLPQITVIVESVLDNGTERIEADKLEAEPQSQDEAMWQSRSGGEWQRGTLLEAIGNVYAGGTVVLLSDVSLTEGITVSKAGYIIVTSYNAENPYTIKNMTPDTNDGKNLGRIFTVTKGELRLQDIILDGGRNEGVAAYHPLVCVTQGGILRMFDGVVLQNAENLSQSLCGGGINIRRGAAFIHGDSRISRCKAWHGGGVEVNCDTTPYSRAQFGMAGGSIENCEAVDGGGIYVNIGMVALQGGEITGNRATGENAGSSASGESAGEQRAGAHRTGGGGVYIAGKSGSAQTAAVLLQGCRIAGNTAGNGGGILVLGEGASLLQMVSGTIEGNAAENGGGVSILRGNLKLFGGTVTGNTASSYGGGILGNPQSLIELQGNPRVFGNTAGNTTDRFDNLYLDGEEDSVGKDATVPIHLIGKLTEGVELGLSRWLRPDEDAHPYRDMIISGGSYQIAQSDLDRLCGDRLEEDKELYADNMEKYALISYENKIVMVRAVDVSLNRNKLTLKSTGETDKLIETVTPVNAPVKEVVWTSSDETVAVVDADGLVTATGEGKALITATTVSPYHAAASCTVKVGVFRFQLTTRAEHGEIIYTPAVSDGLFEEDTQITLQPVPDKGYRLKADSFKAWRTDDVSEQVKIEENTLVMPDYDVTVEAVFEPDSIEKPTDPEPPRTPDKPGNIENPPSDSPKNEAGGTAEQTNPDEYLESYVENGQTGQEFQTVQDSHMIQNPRTGSPIPWMYAAAVLSALSMLILTVVWVKKKNRGGRHGYNNGN
ncbi:MAG: Ig-like domain-containing protein [Blautia sp.]|nr:Ig-like domain-containing protein [Lachnoclostridium sp.]MCM1212274.1 Ig-like domain-containing protein [Blautia sp.]